MNRREVVRALGAGAAGIAGVPGILAAAAGPPMPDARLHSRPHAPRMRAKAGRVKLGLGSLRDGWLSVPATYDAANTTPLMVFLHGASQSGEQMLNSVGALADELGIIVLAPDSRDSTWDFVRAGFGPDVTFIDAALAYVFDRCNVDAKRTAVAGFSDGASYALSIGAVNGDVFPRIIAFSPGFMEVPERHGAPRIFIAHGTRDQILDIDATSRRIVPALKRQGYDVDYREFDGPHTVTPEMARIAFSTLRG